MRRQHTLALALLCSFAKFQASEKNFAPLVLSAIATTAIAECVYNYRASEKHPAKKEEAKDDLAAYKRVWSCIFYFLRHEEAQQPSTSNQEQAQSNPITDKGKVRIAPLFGCMLAGLPILCALIVASSTQVSYTKPLLGSFVAITAYGLRKYQKNRLLLKENQDKEYGYKINIIKGMATGVTLASLGSYLKGV